MIYLENKPINVTMFPDKTSQVWKLDIPERKMVIVRWDFEHEGEIMHLAQLKAILDLHGKLSTLHISYLPYGRQDKDISNYTTFALHAFVPIMENMLWNTIEVYDPHNAQPLRLNGIMKTFYSWSPIAEIRYTINIINPHRICFPDDGAKNRYSKMLSEYSSKFCTGHKQRDQLSGEIISYRIDRIIEENILIIDDICDGGATFIALAKALRDGGAKEINLHVSHGIFSKGLQVLRDAGINRIFTKNGEVNVSNSSI